MESSVSSYESNSRGMNKTCPHCKTEKSLTEFPKDKTREDGIYPICKECHNRRIRVRYKEDDELRKRKQERDRQYLSDPVRRAKTQANSSKWFRNKMATDLEYREKVRAKSKEYERTPERRCKRKISGENRKLSVRIYNNTIGTPRTRERYNSDPEYHERVRNQKNARHHRSKTNGGSFTATEWEFLVILADGKCLSCGMEKKLTIDHIVPVNFGGPTEISNIQPLCGSCNSSKEDKTIDYRSSEFKEKVFQYQL